MTLLKAWFALLKNHVKPVVNGTPRTQTLPALLHPLKFIIFGNSQPIELIRFIEEIEAAAGVEIQKDFQPIQPGDVVATYADLSELENNIGYKPPTPVSEGMQRTVDWYRRFYGIA